jgi:hypothetical protein
VPQAITPAGVQRPFFSHLRTPSMACQPVSATAGGGSAGRRSRQTFRGPHTRPLPGRTAEPASPCRLGTGRRPRICYTASRRPKRPTVPALFPQRRTRRGVVRSRGPVPGARCVRPVTPRPGRPPGQYRTSRKANTASRYRRHHGGQLIMRLLACCPMPGALRATGLFRDQPLYVSG